MAPAGRRGWQLAVTSLPFGPGLALAPSAAAANMHAACHQDTLCALGVYVNSSTHYHQGLVAKAPPPIFMVGGHVHRGICINLYLPTRLLTYPTNQLSYGTFWFCVRDFLAAGFFLGLSKAQQSFWICRQGSLVGQAGRRRHKIGVSLG